MLLEVNFNIESMQQTFVFTISTTLKIFNIYTWYTKILWYNAHYKNVVISTCEQNIIIEAKG